MTVPKNCRFARLVVTGGSSGIGEAITKAMVKLNPRMRVCNLSRSEPAFFSGREGFRHIPADLSDPAEADRALGEARDWAAADGADGRLLLLNNSGFGSYGSFGADGSARDLAMVELNARAPVRAALLFRDLLVSSGGSMVNIASTAAFQPTPLFGTYGATKAFLLHWGLAVAEDWRPLGVQVLTVCPGPTSTRFFQAAGFAEPPLEGGGHTADEVAAATVRALERGRCLVTCGWRNRLLAASASKLPKVLVTRLAGMVVRRLRLERHRGL